MVKLNFIEVSMYRKIVLGEILLLGAPLPCRLSLCYKQRAIKYSSQASCSVVSKRLKESARTLSVRGPSFTLEKILQTVAGSEAEKSSGKKSLEYAKLEKKKEENRKFLSPEVNSGGAPGPTSSGRCSGVTNLELYNFSFSLGQNLNL